MKKLFALFVLLSWFGTTVSAQEFLDPVSWDVKVEKESDALYNILITAKIDEGWHLYSQEEANVELGPIPTEFAFNNTPETFELVGKTQEPQVDPIWDPVFEADIVFFEKKAMFIQKIKVINPDNLKINVEVYYSVCDDEKCLPPETKNLEEILKGKSATMTTK
jgi:thiol:disulfide interchange protein DsbD